jgi:Fe-S cluster biosynthesis and repair protein YggX
MICKAIPSSTASLWVRTKAAKPLCRRVSSLSLASVPGNLWRKRPALSMLINENRLTPIEPKARAFLVAEMEKFLFGGGSEKPKEFVPK